MTEQEKRILPEDFIIVGPDPIKGEQLTRPSLSFWQQARLRLKKDPVAIVCIIFLGFIVVGAILFPLLSSFDYRMQNVAFANKPFGSPDPITGAMHWFGTDNLGRDIFIRLWYGARISLTVAVVVTVIDCAFGVVYGGLSGFMGGRVDGFLMRLLEVISGIPYLIVVLLLLAVLPRGLPTLILAYSLTGWTGMARLVRGQVLGLQNQEFMIAAKVMGARVGRLITRHLVPNLLSIILVNLTLDIPNIIFAEAFLSLLGLGIAPPYPSWGVMASEGMAAFRQYPTQLAVPAICICLTMLALNLLGDRLQDAFDPKLQKEGTNGTDSHN